ncbi:hypothetical protein QLH52_05550 [Methylomonas sp. OY6]|uniref:Uncharacterized protein n=1 Tax=Methylomonas defluvii TaxID=3045149 RepID=A0ABU4UBC0_9GAMM|nr:hypothetical protein [Methylomonas sp. OY6]MDX8126737.1 hypothetical protein [Methylomonas sp. OY6]
MKLEPNHTHQVDVDPHHRYYPTGLDVAVGEKYQFTASGSWRDASHICGPTGWREDWTRYVARFSRLPDYDLFYLCGAIDENEKNNFPIGASAEVTMTANGKLSLFANDLWLFYCNNYRVHDTPMLVDIRRTA